ncbi:SLBB domain-containing protein [Desulfothermus okinawensis JCM 13304]
MIDSGKLPSTSIPGSPTKGSLENKTVKAPVKNKKEAVKELKGVSRIESLYRDRYFGEKQKNLKQFGYNLFANVSPQLTKLAVPDENYILGPGDKLKIRIWGTDVDSEYECTVDRDGTIDVPKIGVLTVSGLKLKGARDFIFKEAKKYAQGIKLKVSLSELRSVEVYILGAVNSPGLYMLPAFSTAFNALVYAGGVEKTGSLRKIYIYRDNKLFKKVDLYDFILKGDTSSDIILKDKDVVFVPPIGSTIALMGAVKQPGIYEISGEKDIGDILKTTGDVLPQGSLSRVYLRRYKDNKEFVIKDIECDAQGLWKNTPIKDGDLLEVKYILNEWPKTVKLEGHVWREEVFKYKKGLKLSDILYSREILKPRAITDYCLLYRYDEKSTQFRVQRIPLEKVLEKKFDMDMKPYDRVKILSLDDFGIKYNVTIMGAVWKPGTYEYHPGMTVSDLIALAGGFKKGVNKEKIDLSRQIITNTEVKTIHLNVDMSKTNSITLEPMDYVFVPIVKDAYVLKTVTIKGEVKFPGTYRIRDGEKLSDLIIRAGGFTKDAYFYGAKFLNQRAREIQQKSLDDLIGELELRANQSITEGLQSAVTKEEVESYKAAQLSIKGFINKLKTIKPEGRITILLTDLASFKGSKYDFALDDGDELIIPKRPNFVAVMGSVYSPGAFLYEPGKTLGEYLKLSGGPTKTADKDYIYVLKANGEVYSRQQVGFFSSFENYKPMPGDTIVVPENFERVPYLRLIKDISDIVFKIATTAGVAIAAL